MGLHIPINSLHNVVMSKMEELVDYEDSEKDDQRLTDGSREGNPPADELENISEDLDESLMVTTEMGDQMAEDTGEEIPTGGELSDSVDVEMSR